MSKKLLLKNMVYMKIHTIIVSILNTEPRFLLCKAKEKTESGLYRNELRYNRID